jgi:hypothetical protein
MLCACIRNKEMCVCMPRDFTVFVAFSFFLSGMGNSFQRGFSSNLGGGMGFSSQMGGSNYNSF